MFILIYMCFIKTIFNLKKIIKKGAETKFPKNVLIKSFSSTQGKLALLRKRIPLVHSFSSLSHMCWKIVFKSWVKIKFDWTLVFRDASLVFWLNIVVFKMYLLFMNRTGQAETQWRVIFRSDTLPFSNRRFSKEMLHFLVRSPISKIKRWWSAFLRSKIT